MRELIPTNRYLRTISKLLGKHPEFDALIVATLGLLQQNPHHPSLETQRLAGTLQGKYACTVAYDLRIVFEFEARKPPELAAIDLIDIGTHDQVYR
jgi:mRNA-degrading endonuclease YafQ of YafQ-DinJ toxin-antitoxin module